MNKYREGDRFQATLIIGEINEEYDEHEVHVMELNAPVDKLLSSEDLDEAFDPNYKERKRLQKIQELRQELEKLENE